MTQKNWILQRSWVCFIEISSLTARTFARIWITSWTSPFNTFNVIRVPQKVLSKTKWTSFTQIYYIWFILHVFYCKCEENKAIYSVFCENSIPQVTFKITVAHEDGVQSTSNLESTRLLCISEDFEWRMCWVHMRADKALLKALPQRNFGPVTQR